MNICFVSQRKVLLMRWQRHKLIQVSDTEQMIKKIQNETGNKR